MDHIHHMEGNLRGKYEQVNRVLIGVSKYEGVGIIERLSA